MKNTELSAEELDPSSSEWAFRERLNSFFGKMANPYYSLTVEVDITSFLKTVNTLGLPFFLSLQYVMMQAVDKTPSFLYRVKDGKIIKISRSLASFTYALEGSSFAFITAKPYLPYEEYIQEALKAEREASSSLEDDPEEMLYMVFISSLPWFSFIGHSMETPSPADYNPRLTWGKYFSREGKILLPLCLQVNHGLIGGKDIAVFLDNLNACLASFKGE